MTYHHRHDYQRPGISRSFFLKAPFFMKRAPVRSGMGFLFLSCLLCCTTSYYHHRYTFSVVHQLIIKVCRGRQPSHLSLSIYFCCSKFCRSSQMGIWGRDVAFTNEL